jgi:NAD(P)-dependent dehydrogenase (short-subunit alcohol dehydrogenase family)
MAEDAKQLVWLITGCSTGLGRALALRVLQHGYRCVVTARNRADVDDIVAAHPDRALAVALDVGNAAQRIEAVRRAVSAFGAIDVLVNNAGHGYSAAVEEGDLALVRSMFETNFFGLAAMTQLVLPDMRRRERGHIVNLSSIGGLVGNPASGYYAASKFAVEGLSEALAKEVAPFGIHVTLIEPGPFRTDFQGRSMQNVQQPLSAYKDTAGARREQLQSNSGRQPGDPDRAAKAIIQIVEREDPPLRVLLGKAAVARAREKLAQMQASIDEWETVSLDADFPS